MTKPSPNRLRTSGDDAFDACPDGGRCWHRCPLLPASEDHPEGEDMPCWRVLGAVPLSGYGATWNPAEQVLHRSLADALEDFTYSASEAERFMLSLDLTGMDGRQLGQVAVEVFTYPSCALATLPTPCCHRGWGQDGTRVVCAGCGGEARNPIVNVDLTKDRPYVAEEWAFVEEWLRAHEAISVLEAGLMTEVFVRNLFDLVRAEVA